MPRRVSASGVQHQQQRLGATQVLLIDIGHYESALERVIIRDGIVDDLCKLSILMPLPGNMIGTMLGGHPRPCLQ